MTTRETDTIEALLRDLEAPIAEIVETAQARLVALGDAAVEALLRALEHPRRALRVGAALTLGRLSEKRALPRLIAIAEGDEDVTVRPLALRAISDIANPNADDALKIFLIRQLGTDDMFNRALACRGLGRIGDAPARQALGLAAKDREKWVRDAAREALASCDLAPRPTKTPASAPSPLSAPDDVSKTSSPAPGQALVAPEHAHPPEVAGLRSLDPVSQCRARDALARRGEAVIPHVAKLLWVPEKATRRVTLELLGRVGSSAAVAQIARVLESDDLEPELRAAALYALGQAIVHSTAEGDAAEDTSASPTFPRTLITAHLDDGDAYIRAAAIVCFASAGGLDRRRAVLALLDDEDEWVHVAGLRALADLVGPDDRDLRDLLMGGLARVTAPSAQAHLLVALTQIIDPPQDDDVILVGPTSFFLDSDEATIRRAALRLVLKASTTLDAAILPRIQEILDDDPETETDIVAALRQSARPDHQTAIPLLAHLLTTSTTRSTIEAAADALTRIGGVTAIDTLIAFANSPRASAKIAAGALTRVAPDASVTAAQDEEGRWTRQLQPRCTCGARLAWVSNGGREELRCPACDTEYVLAMSGRVFDVDRTPFGSCLCCQRKQPLIRGGRGQTLVCPVTNEVHIRPHDAPRQILRLSDLPLGACACCAEPQPLVPVGDRVVCRRTRREHEPGPDGYGLPETGPSVAADIAAINAALLAGSLDIGQSGLPLAATDDGEGNDSDSDNP
ncbi:MAG: HEAT repeat domain-containing protein [Deltaproteobacteria bacterium]|nr:HEAT repeat domain-containing protein [Deltaproteobacteria bacterium]